MRPSLQNRFIVNLNTDGCQRTYSGYSSEKIILEQQQKLNVSNESIFMKEICKQKKKKKNRKRYSLVFVQYINQNRRGPFLHHKLQASS